MNALTLTQSRLALEAARQKAAALGRQVSIAVVDSGGHLLAFERDEQALLASLESAQVKARTAVYFGAPTRFLPMDKPFTPALIGAVSYPIALVPGGIPLRLNDRIVGAIGVGGGSSEEDDAIATAGSAALEGSEGFGTGE